MDNPLCRASAFWEGIRNDSRCDVGSRGTGGGELGGNEATCGTAGYAITDFERVRPRACIPPSGSSIVCSRDPFTGASDPRTSSWSSLCVFLTLLKKEAWLEAEIRSLLMGVECCADVRLFPCACITGGKISM